MPDIPAEAIEAAAEAIMSAANMNDDEPERWESRHLARAALEAAAPLLAGDLKAERDEAQSEAAMIRDHAGRYLRAAYGPDVIYRAPETFENLVERWMWAVSAGVPEIAHACIADIERLTAERENPSALPAGTGEDERP